MIEIRSARTGHQAPAILAWDLKYVFLQPSFNSSRLIQINTTFR